MKRLPRLEIDWAILNLQQHVRRKLSVERLKLFVSCAGTIIAGLHVIDERTPDHDAMMRRHCGGQHVRALEMRATVSPWSGLALAVCLDQKPAEVRNSLVNFVGFCFPPGGHLRIERVGGLQST